MHADGFLHFPICLLGVGSWWVPTLHRGFPFRLSKMHNTPCVTKAKRFMTAYAVHTATSHVCPQIRKISTRCFNPDILVQIRQAEFSLPFVFIPATFPPAKGAGSQTLKCNNARKSRASSRNTPPCLVYRKIGYSGSSFDSTASFLLLISDAPFIPNRIRRDRK
jgi:hypothetical protein